MEITREDRAASISVKFLDIALIVANAVGIVFYLVLASRGWRVSEEHGIIPVTGEPFAWVLALPVLGVFLLVNIVWGVLLLRHRNSKRGQWWILTVGVWLLTICVDFAHH